jgi:hypothetical protein
MLLLKKLFQEPGKYVLVTEPKLAPILTALNRHLQEAFTLRQQSTLDRKQGSNRNFLMFDKSFGK